MDTEFFAMAQGKYDYAVPVIRTKPAPGHGDRMTICTEEGAIYITKRQAMEFFNLVEKDG